ncbi:MAG: hypothetical protein H8E79_04435 [Desulfobulbaceae bacterium]|uniref:Uncharacterized protein n=1 Tax=Candidatus Desulfatifera sulfidica TaxID=2841691 RepID=A0A8J6NBD8_9BACT|nr:hypothetical protein [Candidatus Desulfatifera sulfidica]
MIIETILGLATVSKALVNLYIFLGAWFAVDQLSNHIADPVCVSALV